MKNCVLLAGALVALGFSLPSRANAEGVVLENEALALAFANADSGFAVTSITCRLGAQARFVRTNGQQADFWQLAFAGPNGTNDMVVLDNHAAAASRQVERQGDTTTFRWQGLSLPGEPNVVDVEAKVALPPGKAASTWTLRVANRSRQRALFATTYPYFREVAPGGKADVLRTGGPLGGRLFRNYAGSPSWEDVGVLPSTRPPVFACMIGDAGLYVGAHDPEGRIKRFICGTRQDFRIETPVENAGVVGRAADGPGFAVTVAAFAGDWWQAAKLYRTWALRQKWAAKGPIARRRDFPRAMSDIDVWDIVIADKAAVVSNEIVRLKKVFPGLKLGLHWYCWHNSKFDTNFPEFFPPKPGVSEVMAFGAREGVVMMPYTDPRLWDDKQASWAFARQAACTHPDGREVIERYQGRTFGVMCPHSDTWKESTWAFSRQVLDEANANAIYYDQVGCARAVPCYNPRHGHPVGGGKWWTDGYRAMLEPMHKLYSSRNAPITTEHSGDLWLDLIDGYLHAGATQLEEVPFWPAVYAGYAIYFGNSGFNLKNPPDTFDAYQMRRFVWGIVAGHFDRWKLGDPGYDRPRELIARTARLRRAAAEFMIYGTLEGEIPFIEKPTERDFRLEHVWRTTVRTIRMPEVFGTVWKNLDGTATAIVAGNASGETATLRFTLPAVGFKVVNAPGTAKVAYREEDGVGTLEIPPRGLAFLRADAHLQSVP